MDWMPEVIIRTLRTIARTETDFQGVAMDDQNLLVQFRKLGSRASH